MECENLLVGFSQMLNFNLSLEDDSSSELFVYWTSNHIDGWAAEGNEMGIVFWQGQNSNINFIVNNQQHEERELAIWQLNLRASDEVGNDIIKSWNVTVLDGSSPRINMKLNNQFTLVEPYTGIFLGDSINVNLDSSYDDINRIEDVRFLLSLDGEIFADSDEIGWDGVKSAVIPMLEVGVHELIVNATDLSGNSAEEKSQLFVHPPEIIDIISTEILISEVDINSRTIDTKVNKFLLYKDPLNIVKGVDGGGVYLSERLDRNSSAQRLNKQRFESSRLEDLNIDIPNS